jgi:transposase-like protein
MIHRMARKSYTDEFRRQAVDLYESTPGATLRGIADDLGISRGTLADWVKALGTGSTTASISCPRTPAGRPETAAPGSRPRTPNYGRTRPRSRPRRRSCVRRPNISLGRRTGEPLPVRRRPPTRLRGEAPPPSPTRPPAAARSSDGPPATTPAGGTPTSVSSPRTPTRTTSRLASREPRNHTPRVQHPGGSP